MYLKKIRLQNIKCFEDVTLEFPVGGGWNVILGENGRGKSTILRSIALGLTNYVIGQYGQMARQGAAGPSEVKVGLVFHEPELERSGAMTNKPYYRSLTFSPQGFGALNQHMPHSPPLEGTLPHVLCYGYGPFRRLDGVPYSNWPSLQFPEPWSRFVTLFANELGLPDATRGLIDLYVASVDPKHTAHRTAKQTLGTVIKVVDALLPGGVRLASVTSENVRFEAAPGVDLNEMELSDGYRSFLALVFDLLRHLSARFGPAFPDMIKRDGEKIAVNVEAVVLIDEADAHLHPSWQRELGDRLRRVFPQVQFIVTTHSPFVAQEATDGGLFVLRADENGTVTVEQPVESVRGWTASQILTSPLFGLESTRDPATEALIRENTALAVKKRAGSLTPADKKRLKAVQKQLSLTLSAPGETFEEMQRQQEITAYIHQTLNRFQDGKK